MSEMFGKNEYTTSKLAEESVFTETEEEFDDTFGDIDDVYFSGDIEKDYTTLTQKLNNVIFTCSNEVINKACCDPKLYTFLSKALGDGNLADITMSKSAITMHVKTLIPCQTKINLEDSLRFLLKSDNPRNIMSMFANPVTIIAPIVTYRKTFIIDGHHRWAELYMINPDAMITVININCDHQSPWKLLADFKSSIRDTNITASDCIVKNSNVYEMNEEQIREYVASNITDVCVQSLIDAKVKNNAFAVTDRNTAIEYIVRNAYDLKIFNRP